MRPIEAKIPSPPSRRRLGGPLVLATLIGAGVLFLLVSPQGWQVPLENLVTRLEKLLQARMSFGGLPWYGLLPFAFMGGLVASLSPCILVMLPMNLGYIGTARIVDRRDAVLRAGAFVAGVVTILSMLGLFSSLGALLMVQYRGAIQLAIGLLTVVLGLGFGGLVRLPSMPGVSRVPPNVGPYLFGVVFALISSPCASPILFAVLAAAAASGHPLLSVTTMVSYALGYTGVLFLASVATGFAKQIGALKEHHRLIEIIGASLLVATGIYYAVSGVRWFF